MARWVPSGQRESKQQVLSVGARQGTNREGYNSRSTVATAYRAGRQFSDSITDSRQICILSARKALFFTLNHRLC